jgi:hypothetical protein
MSKFTDNLKLIAALWPVAKTLLETAESAFGSGKGAEKLAYVREMLQSAYEALDQGYDAFQSVWPAIQRLITITVTAYNAIGKFKKGAK